MRKRKFKLKRKVKYLLVISLLLLVVISLFYAAYYIYSSNRKISYYDNSYSYSYIVIEKMSDAFAATDKKSMHFVRDSKNNLYIVAINKNDIKKYQEIIDYSYNKTKKKKTKKVYVYPIKVDNKTKKLAIKYINKFLPFTERIEINNKNYNKHFTNMYLDTTIKTKYKFNYIVFILFFIVVIGFLNIVVAVKKQRNTN